MYYKTLCFFLYLFPLIFNAQTGCRYKLSGRVIDEHDGEVLPFANMIIKESGKGTASDTRGYYEFTELCAGIYTIQCSHVGCESIEKTITLTENTTLDFYPEHHLEELKAFNVTAVKSAENIIVAESKIYGRDLEVTRGLSLAESLKKSAGVTTLNTGSGISKPVIHGLHSNRILIMNNGVRQEGQQWGSEHAPEIDPFIANSLTVIKGANSVRYGSDAIAGVILVEPKSLRDSAGIGGEFNTVGFSNGRQGTLSGLVEGNFAKLPALSWRAQGTYKRSGNVKTADYYLKNTGLKEHNFSLASNFQKERYGIGVFYSQFNTDVGIFSGSHIGNLTDLELAIESKIPTESSGFSYKIDRPSQHIEHELFKVNAYFLTGTKGKLKLVYARQYNLRNEYDKHKSRNDSIAALNHPALELQITTHTADIIWEHNRIGLFTGQIGINGSTQGNSYSGRYFIPNYRNYGTGVFWIERAKFSKLELEGGFRYDYRQINVYKYEGNVLTTPVFEYGKFAGSVGGIYKPFKALEVTLNIGSAWRPPAVSELFSNGLHHGAATVEIGDKNLVSEKALNITSSINYTFKKIQMEINPYFTLIHDFIYLSPSFPATLTIRGAFPTYQYKQVDAMFKGLDFTGKVDFLNQFSFSSKLSVLRAFNKNTSEYLTQMPSDRYENTIEFKPKDIKKWKENYLSVSLLSVMKQWRIAANSDYTPPPEAYSLLNISIGTSLSFGKQKIIIGLGINNVLNTAYRDYMNRFRYYADDMGRSFSVRLKIPFQINSQKNKPTKN